MLNRSHSVAGGLRVRLCLARPSDAAAVRALLAARGLATGELDVRRLLAHDPSKRTVVCAFAPIDGAETLVGIGAIDLDEDAEVDTLIADPGVAELLVRVLTERARSYGRRVA